MEQSNPYIKRNCAAYVRVSSEEQTIENQKQQISLFCERNPFDITNWYQDEGVSAWNKNAMAREGFRRMIEEIKANPTNKPDAILTYKLDRLGRNQADTIAMFQLIEKDFSIPIISVTDSWLQSTNQDIRQLLISVFTWFAQYESSQISQRTKAGMERARLQGIHIGRRFQAEITSQVIQNLRSQDKSYRQIAFELNCSLGTIFNRLNMQ